MYIYTGLDFSHSLLQLDCPTVLWATPPTWDTFLEFPVMRRLWADAVASLSLTPSWSPEVALADKPDQELKQAPIFPRLNIVIICNPH